MALTFIQTPDYGSSSSNFTYPLWWRNHVIFGISESVDLSSYFKVKFILRVYEDSIAGNLVATLRQPWNGYENGAGQYWRTFFDIKDIVGSTLDFTVEDASSTFPTQRAIHGLGTSLNNTDKPVSTSNNVLKRFTIQGSYEYSTTATGSVVEYSGTKPEFDIQFLNSTYFTPPEISTTTNDLDYNPIESLYKPAASPLGKFFSNVPTDEKVGTQYDFTELSSAGGVEDLRFNNTKYLQFIGQNDKATLSFMANNSSAKTTITVYKAASSVTGYFLNNATNGGGSSSSPADDSARLIHIGAGPQNLNQQTISNASNINGTFTTGDWLYYVVNVESTASAPGVSDYYFVNQKYMTNCQMTNQWNNLDTIVSTRQSQSYIRLGWINAFGCWDYFNFAMKNTSIIEIKETVRKQTPSGEFSGENYTENTFANTDSSVSIGAIRSMTLNSGYMSEGTAKMLQWLLKSPLVQYIRYGTGETSVPVIIKSTSMDVKTTINNGSRISYTINIQFSHNEPVTVR